MHCGICTRESARLHCVSCAQSAVWSLRYEHLSRISERDAAVEKVHEYIEGHGGKAESLKLEMEQVRLSILEIREQTARVRESHAADMHKVEELRRENERRRQLLEEAIKARDRLEETVTMVQRDTRRINSKWKTLHARTAEARSYLCREAATLYGLRQKRRRSGRTDYSIGGVPIPNFLQDLNSHPHIQITTSLAHLAHLLLLVSHYLGLKLPNEIILPTQSAPHTQIRGVLNARHTVVRPLHLDRPLSELSRDSPAAHTKFIEGISLLAINVSYLCFTQGLEINEVDPACAPGANMWQLLVSREPVPAFGRVSHATCNGNLATAPKIAAMTRFKVGYKSVVEKIRNTLQGETIIAGWDLVPDAGAEPAEGKGMGWTRIRAPGEEK